MNSPTGASAGGVKVSFRMPNSGEELLSSSAFHTAFADGEICTPAGMLMNDAVPRSWDGCAPTERKHIHILHFTYLQIRENALKWKQLIFQTSHWVKFKLKFASSEHSHSWIYELTGLLARKSVLPAVKKWFGPISVLSENIGGHDLDVRKARSDPGVTASLLTMAAPEEVSVDAARFIRSRKRLFIKSRAENNTESFSGWKKTCFHSSLDSQTQTDLLNKPGIHQEKNLWRHHDVKSTGSGKTIQRERFN